MRALIHVAVSVVLTNSTLKDSIKSVLITELQNCFSKRFISFSFKRDMHNTTQYKIYILFKPHVKIVLRGKRKFIRSLGFKLPLKTLLII